MNKQHDEPKSIPKSWKIVDFQTVAELKHGYQFRTPDFTKNGSKVFKITQIKSNGLIDITNCDFIAKERVKDFEKFIIKHGDILMALTGATIGKVAQFDKNEIALQNYRVGNFIPLDESILSRSYFYYFLNSDYFFNQVLSRQTQSAQQNIGKDEINKMRVILPDIGTQIRIGDILKSLDNKIELNNQLNQTLEAIARTIFNSWFVDYEPVKAKMSALQAGGNQAQSELAAMMAISGKSAEQLSAMQTTQAEAYQQLAETASLFPGL